MSIMYMGSISGGQKRVDISSGGVLMTGSKQEISSASLCGVSGLSLDLVGTGGSSLSAAFLHVLCASRISTGLMLPAFSL